MCLYVCVCIYFRYHFQSFNDLFCIFTLMFIPFFYLFIFFSFLMKNCIILHLHWTCHELFCIFFFCNFFLLYRRTYTHTQTTEKNEKKKLNGKVLLPPSFCFSFFLLFCMFTWTGVFYYYLFFFS